MRDRILVASADATLRLRARQALDRAGLECDDACLDLLIRLAGCAVWEWVSGADVLRVTGADGPLTDLAASDGRLPLDALLPHLHRDDRNALCGALADVASPGFALETRFASREGVEHVLHWRGEPARDECGRTLRMAGIVRDVTEAKRTEQRVRFLAYHDGLTGTLNRNALIQQLQRSLRLARRHGRLGALLFLDLDGFKRVNDGLGHAAGDRMLQSTAQRVERCLRGSDLVARSGAPLRGHVSRLGGDEFIILLSEVARPDDAAKVARRILDALREPFVVCRSEVLVGASIGIAVFPADGEDAEELIRKADAAMYHAKENGRHRFEFYTESISRTATRRLTIESRLSRAFESHELAIFYQPQVCLVSGRITGVEALLRWEDPELGPVAPAEFVAVAEQAGLIPAIDAWVLRSACRQVRAWQDAGLPHLRLSVNVSPRHFNSRQLLESVNQVLWDTGIEASGVELEITETAFMERRDAAVEIARELKRIGVTLALDDFGTGYSSLGHLRHFPVDTIKIDRSFVRDLVADPEDAAITSAILSMAKILRLRTVAEGVENEQQRDFLRDRGCGEMQGFLVSPPVGADALAEILRGRARAT